MEPQIRKKVIIGITKSNFGGAQRYVFDLAVELKNQGIDVSVLCGGQGPLIDKLHEENISVIALPILDRDLSLFKDWRSMVFILRTLREKQPDVFHINSSKMGGLGGLAARLVGIKKIVFTAHGWAFNESRPLYQKILIKCAAWFTLLLSHTTICVSIQTREDVRHWPIIKSRLTVIHNGLKSFETLSHQAAREKLLPRIQNETFLAGAIAELHYTKGLDILLLAWAKFKEDHPGELVIIGEGEERDNLLEFAHSLGIQNSVHFLGFIDDARRLLAGFDVCILPSRSEAMPYVPLEAGLNSIPMIATKVGGIPEMIEDTVSGILIQRENAAALFSAILLLAEHNEMREKLGKNLKKVVEDNFSLEKMVHATLEVYD